MFFAITWKNKAISLEELKLIEPKNIKHIWKNIITFDTEKKDILKRLWWIIKRWIVSTINELKKSISTDIIWTNNNKLWSLLKKTLWIKRFKLIDLISSDLEIKTKWTEIILIDKEINENPLIWIVKWYQNIKLYEEIDFNKPCNWMNVGMMPSKLTHILVNIWLNNIKSNENITIYDPFVWFWTTWFLSNYFWYNFIASDINITPFKQNVKRWLKSNFSQKDVKITNFKQDITTPLSKNFLKNVNLIVTEWWLWHIVKNKTKDKELESYINKVFEVYKWFLENINDFYQNISIVLTIPIYIKSTKYKDILHNQIKELLTNLWLEHHFINEIYSRKWQNVWREIIIINK